MPLFDVVAEWRVEHDAADTDLQVATQFVAGSNLSARLWRDARDPQVLRLSLKVEAQDYDEAAEHAGMCFRLVANGPLAGQLMDTQASDGATTVRWKPLDP